MAEVRLATTPAAGLRRLGVHGQQVVGMHRQLTAILGNRLGRQHAQLFARPDVSPAGDTIDWYASKPGPAAALDQLPAGERQSAETLVRQLRAEIGQLAEKMKREGGSAELAGHMLELAATTTTPVEPAFSLRAMAARPITRPPVGAYDLAIEVAPGVVERAPRASI